MIVLIRVAFVVVGALLLVLAHLYLRRRLLRDTALPHIWRRAGTAALVGLAAAVPGAWVAARLFQSSGVVVYAAFVWIGLLFYLCLLLGAWDAGRHAVRGMNKLRGIVAPPDDPGRRAFLARAVAGTAFGASTAIGAVGLRNALGDITTPEVEVKLDRLPRRLSGLTIAQLSDVHIGPILDGRFLEHLVEQTNAMKPDLVVITGDLVDGSVEGLGPAIATLGNLRSRYGTFFCTGNHEYYSGADDWNAFLGKIGIRVLMNERVSIGDKGASFDLAGIPDPQGAFFSEDHRASLSMALDGRDEEREVVLLAHRPSQVDNAAARRVGLQLSGHTHGGQLWPFGQLARLSEPYLSGLHRHGDLTQVYVSRGTGFWGPPMRVMAPAEIARIVLT